MRTLFPLPPAKREADIAREIRAYLESLGLTVHRANAAASRGRRAGGSQGLPDFFGVLPGGRAFAVEVKRPKASRRPNETAQNAVLKHWRDMGALVVVARSVLEVRAVFNSQTVPRMPFGMLSDPAPYEQCRFPGAK